MDLRPDLLDETSPRDIEVIQLTTDPELTGSHLYMEAQIFAPDSRHFLLHQGGAAHGGDRRNPAHQWFRCDIEDNCSLHQLTSEVGAWAPSLSPDGKAVFYFVDESDLGEGSITLKRVNLDGTDRQTIMVLDGNLPGTAFRPSRLYPLSTISPDGRRLAISCFLADGKTMDPTWGLLVFDLARATVQLVIHGPSWCNMHPQYTRSRDLADAHEIMIQENHGNTSDRHGQVERLTGGAGADIHMIRDDGTDFRTMPWGRDGIEFCQGHQCWRGQTNWAITSTSTRFETGSEAQLIEAQAMAGEGHLGRLTPGAVRNDMTRDFPNPHFHHFATDSQGKRLVSDAKPFQEGGRVFIAALGEPGTGPLTNFTCLLNARSSCTKDSHIHPFLSPDGTMAFYNSDESGILQAYMIRGLGAV
ncbi:MAG: hypothetical protein HN904_25885 [Victivallales bacterium]|jgi:hypothetical protein|nr:hypothetical protein [Victivallales bacterium]